MEHSHTQITGSAMQLVIICNLAQVRNIFDKIWIFLCYKMFYVPRKQNYQNKRSNFTSIIQYAILSFFSQSVCAKIHFVLKVREFSIHIVIWCLYTCMSLHFSIKIPSKTCECMYKCCALYIWVSITCKILIRKTFLLFILLLYEYGKCFKIV